MPLFPLFDTPSNRIGMTGLSHLDKTSTATGAPEVRMSELGRQPVMQTALGADEVILHLDDKRTINSSAPSVPPVPPPPGPIFQDEFARPDSTALAAPWITTNGTWQTQGGNARQTQNGTALRSAAVVDIGRSDCEVSAGVVIPASGAFAGGLCLRYTDANNYWQAYFDYYDTVHVTLHIVEYNAATPTSRGTVTLMGLQGTTVTLDALMANENIYLFVNGILKLQYNQATFNQTAIKHGVYAYRDTSPGADIGNFTVLQNKAEAPASAGLFDIVLPTNYDPTTTKHLLIQYHGYQNITPPVYFTSDFLGRYILAASTSGGLPADAASYQGYRDFYDYCRAMWSVDAVVAFGQSAGGAVGLTALLDTSRPICGWIGIYPDCTGSWTSGPPTYPNPCTVTPSQYAGKFMRFYASYGDTTMSQATNTDVLAQHVAGYARENWIVECTGNHGDASHFQSTDASDFLDRAVTDYLSHPAHFAGVTSIEIGAVNTSTVSVLFAENVSASNFSTGVIILVDGSPATISSATLQGDNRTVRYVLASPVTGLNTLLWSYNAATGTIINGASVPMPGMSNHLVTNTIYAVHTLVLQPNATDGPDVFITLAAPNYNNSVPDTQVIVQAYDITTYTSRALFMFDISSLPGGAVIDSVTLSLHLATVVGAGTLTMDVHRLTHSWTKAGVTWNKYDGASAWATPGGDYDATVLGSASVSAAPAWYDFTLSASVIAALLSANYGVLVKGASENGGINDRIFDASGGLTSSLYPKLTIVYH